MRLELNGAWKIRKVCWGEDISAYLQEDYLPLGWLDGCVPGDVRTVLREQGLISGHYLGKKLDDERWIENHDWLWYRRFVCPAWTGKGEAILRLEGIDTLALVYLNGALLGRCDNMFIPWEFDVTALLRRGEENTLLVRVLSPEKEIQDVDRTGLYPQEDTSRLLLRKSQMNYGWDFCGHCLTGGLWKGVSLEWRDGPRIAWAHLRTESIGADQATLRFSAKACGPDAKALQWHVALKEKDGTAVFSQTLSCAEEAAVHIDAPHLWWPRPYGEAYLYNAEITLMQAGQPVDTRSFRFGIRTVELLQNPHPLGGREFCLRINGRRMFIRGANWVPCNAVYAEITPEQIRYYLERAEESNLSMLRVWGGGIYESELFYDLCDEKGILIMQDFMLACGILPQDEKFLAQVENEAGIIVRALYNHACIAVWSADNELDEAYTWYDLQDHFKENKVNRVAVRKAVNENDPYRPFLISSPCSPFEDEPGGDVANSPLQGDMHIYLTRFLPDSPYYYRKITEFVPRFMSEYGFSSLPCEESYQKFNFYQAPLDMKANPWLGEHPAFMDMQQKHDVAGLIYYSQFSHAQGLKYFIEYMRSHKGLCWGSLYWKFNDPIAPNRENMLFPTLMSSIDCWGQPKLPYYYARRAYEDTILAFREEGDRLLVFCCTEEDRPIQGTFKLSFVTFEGHKDLLEQRDIQASPDGATCLCDFQAAAWRSRTDGYFLAEFCGMENRFDPQDIGYRIGKRPPLAHLQVSCEKLGDTQYALTVETDKFAQDIWLEMSETSVRYSDNAFCLDAGGRKRITVTLANKGIGLPAPALRLSAANADAQTVRLQ